MLSHAAWLGIALTAAAAQGPALDLAPRPRPVPPAPAPATPALRRELERLRAERQAAEADKSSAVRDAAAGTGDEAARLRRRIAELLGRLTAAPAPPQPPRPPSPPPPAPAPTLRFEELPAPAPADVPAAGPVPHPAPAARAQLKPGEAVDWLGLACSSFQSGNFEEALKAYRQAARTARGGERVIVQYMTATCLRKLGKSEEAAALYREVAGARSEVFLADCARWQLSAMAWRQDIARQRDELRKRREAGEGRP